MSDRLSRLENIAAEVIATFEIKTPPVPIEYMLQHPRPGMWKEVDIRQLSGGFLSVKDRYSPRMSLARLLARHIYDSEWGAAHDLRHLVTSEDELYVFARMLIMPAAMIAALSESARVPVTLRMHFEVPEEDARQRLEDLTLYS